QHDRNLRQCRASGGHAATPRRTRVRGLWAAARHAIGRVGAHCIMTRSATPRTDELCFDVAVFGGGIIGASIAGALVELGMTVILIERGCIGSQGASRYSGGIVRLYDPDEAIEALAAYSLVRMVDTAVGRAFGACITRTGVC